MADEGQKIARLTPLADALAALDRLAGPVMARDIDASEAAGSILAHDVAAGPLPAHAQALRDGFAVTAADLDGASSYAPIALPAAPPHIETGDEMPAGADAVAPPEAIVFQGDTAEAVASLAPGEGVTPAGGESDPSQPLRKAGERVHNTDVAVLAAAGIDRVTVRRPRIDIAAAREDLRLLPALQFIVRDCAARGCDAHLRNGVDADGVLADSSADAVVIVGGSGQGARDSSVRALAAAGQVAIHGVALMPGDTAALGQATSRPVLIVPGRLDAAIAVWLTLGRHLVARLSAQTGREPVATRTLIRKVASPVGIAEVVPVRCEADNAEPLARQHLPLRALARADGWLLVPANSEGYAAGSTVTVNEWP
jgi:molybdopterin biosynthesis enzyme